MVTNNSNSQKYSDTQAIQNDYPTVSPSVFGSSITSVDTLINNMRVNNKINPQFKTQWLKKGYADGLFLASGRRIPRTGGVILAKCDSRETLQARLSQDPFQQLGLARTEIIPFEASMASPALQSLL